MVTEMVTQKDVSKFQRLYKKHFGTAIDDQLARQKLETLVRQMQLVYQPITKQQLQEINVNGDVYGKSTTEKH